MIERRPTCELAAGQVAAHVKPLEIGALPPPFELREAQYNWQLKQDAGFFWPVLDDCSGAVFAAYGLHLSRGEQVRLVLLTPARQVRSWFDDPEEIDAKLDEMMNQIDARPAQDARWFPLHAPVLIVPHVLAAVECRRLIQAFESGGPFRVKDAEAGEPAGDYRMPVYEHNRQDRVDHMSQDPGLPEFLTGRIGERINRLLKQAFAFEVNRREALHIARYTGARGGVKMGHRDNTGAETAYRRFALSMNLNDDYDGGEIVFREFSPHGFRGAPGTALVFSSSLLHEVLETTRGVRYHPITHLFSEATLAAGRSPVR